MKRIVLTLLGVFLVAGVALGIWLRNPIRTVWSLQRVAGTQMYTMDYYGSYNIDEIYRQGIDPDDLEGSLGRVLLPDVLVPLVVPPKKAGESPGIQPPAGRPAHACTTVAFHSKDGQMYVGRNFDWMHNPCLILRIHGREHFSSVAILDPCYLGLNAERLAHPSLTDRIRLLAAPYLVMDGMNEHGVVITNMALDGTKAPYDPAKPTVISPLAMRLILDYAWSTDEALTLLERFNLQFPEVTCHYLIADAEGKSVVVEFIDGRMQTIPSSEPWQVSTNHQLLGKSESENDLACRRYRIASDRAADLDGNLDAQEMMNLMASVAQDGTMWTSVYNLSTGEFRVAFRQQYDHVYAGRLERRANRADRHTLREEQ